MEAGVFVIGMGVALVGVMVLLSDAFCETGEEIAEGFEEDHDADVEI